MAMTSSTKRIPFLLLCLLLQFSILLAETSFNLQPFRDCESLLSYYKTRALDRASSAASFDVQPIGIAFTTTADGPVSAPIAEAASVPVAGTDFSETNVQVAGVGEPDIIKADGKRVFVLNDRTLRFVAVQNNGTSGNVIDSLSLSTSGSEMLFHKNSLLVIANDFSFVDPVPFRKPHRRNTNDTRNKLSIALPRNVFTNIYKVKISEEKLRLVETLRIEGRYISGRSSGGIARVVTSYSPYYTTFRPFSPLLDAALQVRTEYIQYSTLEDWAPKYTLTRGSCTNNCEETDSGSLPRCDNTFQPTAGFGGYSMLTLTSLPFEGSLKPIGTESIVSDGDEVYSTATPLYVSTKRFRSDMQNDMAFIGRDYRTAFHKFQLIGNRAEYIASGSVKGSVLNQFSMHERDGVFFVATTEGAAWWSGLDLSRSKVTSFEVQNKKLVQIGEVGNLGLGERIFAVRYIRDVAYVVTFRQIDPLYVIDISKPRALSVSGELKIPGFSSYLHYIGDGRILGVGRDATEGGVLTGAKVSLFDVSDPTKPKETAVWAAPGGTTAAQFDHRAFLFWAPEKVAVLPLFVPGSLGGGDAFTGAVVLHVQRNDILLQGRISHKRCCGFNARSPRIVRNIVLGRTKLWSLSKYFLQMNDIGNLSSLSDVEN